MILSISQINQFTACPRKWWFRKCARLIPPPSNNVLGKTFGSVLHAVIERFLTADASGRDALGNPVSLYPPGWEISEDGYALDEENQALVKRLVDKAIEEGHLIRMPNREVEKEFCFVLDGDTYGSAAVIVGKIDEIYPDRIVDHKSGKSKRWVVSKQRLKKDPQLVLYSSLIFMKPGSPDKITLQHNNFIRDTEEIAVRKTTITKAEALAHVAHIMGIARQMVDLKKDNLPDTMWREVWGSMDHDDAKTCSAYGGCPYLQVCAGVEALPEFKRRAARTRKLRVCQG